MSLAGISLKIALLPVSGVPNFIYDAAKVQIDGDRSPSRICKIAADILMTVGFFIGTSGAFHGNLPCMIVGGALWATGLAARVALSVYTRFISPKPVFTSGCEYAYNRNPDSTYTLVSGSGFSH